MKKKISPFGLLMMSLVLTACAGSIPSVTALAKAQQAEQGSQTSVDSYIVGPGDILAVDVWKEPELSKQVSVRLDGKISLPLVEEIQAAGLSTTELRDSLAVRYQSYVESPVVSVVVVESRSKKIYLLGKVAKPGEYVLQKDMTVVQAISLAGGLAEWADTSDVKLIRKTKGVEKTFRVNYDAIVTGKDPRQNVQLEPDDTIFVP